MLEESEVDAKSLLLFLVNALRLFRFILSFMDSVFHLDYIKSFVISYSL